MLLPDLHKSVMGSSGCCLAIKSVHTYRCSRDNAALVRRADHAGRTRRSTTFSHRNSELQRAVCHLARHTSRLVSPTVRVRGIKSTETAAAAAAAERVLHWQQTWVPGRNQYTVISRVYSSSARPLPVASMTHRPKPHPVCPFLSTALVGKVMRSVMSVRFQQT